MKNDKLIIRISDEEKNQLAEVSTALDIPLSQIVREAIREKITELKKAHPRLIETRRV